MENNVVNIPSNIGPWTVDFELNQITLVDNPSIVVPLAYRFSGPSGYTFGLDMEQECLSESPQATTVKVPHLLRATEQSRSAFIEHYGLQGLNIDGLTDQQAKELQPALKERMAMQAVTIDIAGKTYTVDYYEDAFMPEKGSRLPPINFDDVKRFYDPKSDTCMFLIDMETRSYSSELKPGTVVVQTAHPYRLDPVRLGMSYDLDVYGKVMDHGPLKNHHIAKTVSMEPTNEQQHKNQQHRRHRHRL